MFDNTYLQQHMTRKLVLSEFVKRHERCRVVVEFQEKGVGGGEEKLRGRGRQKKKKKNVIFTCLYLKLWPLIVIPCSFLSLHCCRMSGPHSRGTSLT